MPDPVPAAAPTIDELVDGSRSSAIHRLLPLLGSDDDGGPRIAQLVAGAGYGSSAVVARVAARWGGEVLLLDGRTASTAPTPSVPASGPRLLVVVDHAWESAATASTVSELVESLADDARASLLLVVRAPALASGARAWQETVAEFAARGPVPVVDLSPLADDDVARLVEQSSSTRSVAERRRIVEASQGSPAVARLLARGQAGRTSLESMVAGELDGLDPDDPRRSTVETIALVADGLSGSLLAADPSSLPFVRRRPDGRWGIEPPAIAEVIRVRVGAARRRALAAAALERARTSPGDVDLRHEVVQLADVRGDAQESWEVLRTLVHDLVAEGSLDEAAVRSRELVDRSIDSLARLDALELAARVQAERGLRIGTEHALLELRRVAAAAGDAERHAWSFYELAFVRQDPSLLDSPELAALDAAWALNARIARLRSLGRYAAAAPLARELAARATGHPDPLLGIVASEQLAMTGMHLPTTDADAIAPEVAGGMLQEVVERAWSIGQRRRSLIVAHHVALAASWSVRWRELERFVRPQVERAREAGRPDKEGSLGSWLGLALLEQGRIEEAAALVDALRTRLDERFRSGFDVASVELVALAIALERGWTSTGEAARALAELERARGLEASIDDIARLLSARVRASVGDFAAALDELGDLDDVDADDASAAVTSIMREAIVRGEEAVAADAWARRRPRSDDPALPLAALAFAEADALRPPVDPSLVEAAAARWRDAGAELRALRLEVVAALLRRPLDIAVARDLKSRVRDAGMRGAEDRLNAALRQAGERAVAVATPRGDAPLSPRELEVARLVAEGLTNAQVGDRLGIRPATVARILANVYRRHALSGRSALVEFLTRLERGR